jgi:hypothetical protein
LFDTIWNEFCVEHWDTFQPTVSCHSFYTPFLPNDARKRDAALQVTLLNSFYVTTQRDQRAWKRMPEAFPFGLHLFRSMSRKLHFSLVELEFGDTPILCLPFYLGEDLRVLGVSVEEVSF